MTPLSVKAIGMVTSVGFNAPASCAAMRAGIRNVNETNLWDAESGTYLAAGKVSLPHWWIGLGKLAELVAPAIHECLLAARPVPPDEIPLLVGVAAPDRPCRWDNLDEQIMDEVEYRLGSRFHSASKVIPRGRVSGIVGIQEAGVLIARYGLQYCIVAGVDSFVRQDMVEVYLEKRRILTPKNSNGFSPGEAGTACLVGRPQKAPDGELHILSTSITREEATIESEAPMRAEGLTKAYREVLSQAGLSIFDMDYRITDLNGEQYKFKEAALTAMRFERKPKQKLFDLWHPIEFIGDVGAAIGPCLLGFALHASLKGYGVGPTVLLHFGNDNGERAAAIVRYGAGGDNQ
jgi:3-oxoacyl-[acyl-carrier-protein] synthase-1